MRALIGNLSADLDALEARLARGGGARSYADVMHPLERITDRLARVWGVVTHLKVRRGARAAPRAAWVGRRGRAQRGRGGRGFRARLVLRAARCRKAPHPSAPTPSGPSNHDLLHRGAKPKHPPRPPPQNVRDSAELRAAVNEANPGVLGFQLRLGQSRAIYDALKALKGGPGWRDLNSVQQVRPRRRVPVSVSAAQQGVRGQLLSPWS